MSPHVSRFLGLPYVLLTLLSAHTVAAGPLFPNQAFPTDLTGTFSAVRTGDFDQDGTLDIACGAIDYGPSGYTGQYQVLRGLARGEFQGGAVFDGGPTSPGTSSWRTRTGTARRTS